MRPLQILLLLGGLFALQPITAQIPRLNSYPSAAATVFIDFDGQYVSGTSWNMTGDINALPAGYSTAVITEIFGRVAEDFRPFNLNITTDSTQYWAAPRYQRMRIIVTPTSQWYGAAGGVAYTGSFVWGDNTPAWVFCALLGDRTKWVAEAISHEVGHTLGLQHQSVYDAACVKTAEYNTGLGTGEIGWAPIMGAGYYQNHTTWNIGPNTINCSSIQNDFAIISANNGFGLRPDDHGNTLAAATPVNILGGVFSASGLINTRTDVDIFTMTLAQPGWLTLNAIPQNVGAGDDGANIDIKLTLMNGTDTIHVYNPSTLLNAGVDTNLNAGTYYWVVDGAGNIYHDDEGSIGLYHLSGSLATLLPIQDIAFTGKVINQQHALSWSLPAAQKITAISVESSADGQHFNRLATLHLNASSFVNKPNSNQVIYYRLRVSSALQQQDYISPAIALRSNGMAAGLRVTALQANAFIVESNEKYAYQLYNTAGQLAGSGTIYPGRNTVTVSGTEAIWLLHCSNGLQSFTQKIIKQ
ncbi:MAG TPA: hypothetical protein VL307_18550 [Chitinophagaceae bacterium]|nr:hypothetical protein [Chitinophagaceae bacterium]